VVNQWPEDIQEDVDDLVGVVSRALTKRYWKYMNHEDIRQGVGEYAWRKREKISEYLRMEDRKGGWAASYTSLYRAGDKYCRKTKAEKVGYKARDEFFYDKALIAEVVRYAYTGVMPRPEETGVKPPKNPAEGGNLMAMLADVTSALGSLEQPEQALLLSHYGKDESSDILAKREGISRQVMDRRIDNLLGKMVDYLGGPSPYPAS
jgi:DNA-directed RNA polymerase specialized sigma24 family protein